MSKFPGTPSEVAEEYWKSLPSGLLPAPNVLEGRITILDVGPAVESGRRPAKAAAGESIPFSATVFREGHDEIGANVVLRDSEGNEVANKFMQQTGDPDTRVAHIRIPEDASLKGIWTFTIEAWANPVATWLHRADIKIAADVDSDLELQEGALLLEASAETVPAKHKQKVLDVAEALRNTMIDPADRLELVDGKLRDLLAKHPTRDLVTTSGPWPLQVDRRRALFGSWYELFPRSEGATVDSATGAQVSGTFATAAERLPAVADMGFDVVYMPPIHPIGKINRKGANNSVEAADGDVGSPWAIGSDEGGHTEVHPDLGTLDDFDAFVAKAKSLDLEVALDLALQVAPDHPWAREGKPWFVVRADGTIAYAENPPKKYQDIYPIWFDGDPAGLHEEVVRIIRFWAERGVRIFRVDNPHTKPVRFWERVLCEIRQTDPDIIFLAEAFTRRPMMRALAEIGYHQSYTYFTWRTEKNELTRYMDELARESSPYMRPNLFVNTPDILHEYLQYGGPGAFAIRATLAATLSPSWGMYAGYELYEHVAVKPDSEEYLDSEKYQLRPRDWEGAAKGNTLVPYVTMLNQIRREHPALQDLRSLYFHKTDSDNIICFSKRDGDDQVIVVCTLDPYGTHEATIYFDMEELDFDPEGQFRVTDEISGGSWVWSNATYVRLDPYVACAHIVTTNKGTV